VQCPKKNRKLRLPSFSITAVGVIREGGNLRKRKTSEKVNHPEEKSILLAPEKREIRECPRERLV